MFDIFREVRILRQEGKLHDALIRRTQMLFVISIILLAIVFYNVATGTSVWIALILGVIGFLLGLLVFSRMTKVEWNEEESLVETGRMGTVGFVTLGLYIVFEVGLRTFLKDAYPASATAFLLAGIFGTLFGRAVGTVIEIHRVFESTHPA